MTQVDAKYCDASSSGDIVEGDPISVAYDSHLGNDVGHIGRVFWLWFGCNKLARSCKDLVCCCDLQRCYSAAAVSAVSGLC